MSSHTPGPWDAEHRDENGNLMMGRECHEVSGTTHYTIETTVLGDRIGAVADTFNRHHCIDAAQDAANAILIAAAPELLESLKETLSAARIMAKLLASYGVPLYGLPSELNGFGVRASRAIEKAEGGATISEAKNK